jgi:hypothetical protein
MSKLVDPNLLLPWEGDELSDEDKEKLGGLLDVIMPLLHRDPAQRGTVSEFRDSVDRLLEQEPQH